MTSLSVCMLDKTNNRLSRRNILKTGATALGGISLSPVATATTKRNGRTKFIGIAYDSRTVEKLGSVEAHLDRGNNDMMAGSIELPNVTLPLDIRERQEWVNWNDSGQGARFTTRKAGRFTYDGRSSRVNISSVDGGDISGTLKQLGRGGKATSFRITTKKSTESRDEAIERLWPEGAHGGDSQ